MNHAHIAWMKKRKDGKINHIENEFRQRFKLTLEQAHELILNYMRGVK
jgi:hypothetical protein